MNSHPPSTIAGKAHNSHASGAQSTICAVSTPYGVGGIAVVRVSGPEALSIVDRLFVGKQPLSQAKPNTIHYGRIADLDEVLVSVFRAPHSFTGEDVVEIACHGSLYIQQTIIQRLIEAGCAMAAAGEFTRRALMNGKLDLTQAEAVADLIASQSKAEHDLALKQLRGSVSNEIATLRDRLLHLTSLIELELDFADHEELEFASRPELQAVADEIEAHLVHLTNSFKTGNAIRNGLPVAIVGPTNAGKSTLLNALLGEQRAIVSDIQGTTRDTIEDTLVIEGILFRLIDTAGLRETQDEIEQMGIERTKAAIEKAAIILDLSAEGGLSAQHSTSVGSPYSSTPLPLYSQPIIHIVNKSDLMSEEQKAAVDKDVVLISAKNGDLSNLRERLVAMARTMIGATEGVCITGERHYEALLRALRSIRAVQEGLRQNISGEFLSMDLQDVLTSLGEVTGQVTNDEVLSNIFSKFCIGK